ncbi:PLP-dependent aminotransferase family protein [Streptomyces sp. NPDC049577]|uniref:aminotransferase-like domain-containing protein n=1 Tax=Streptomyces sp. NPDC049577 TaxID=3155153 RepID=UPI003431FDC4
MTLLDESTLHGSLRDPVLGSLTFLNEIMSRHPGALSFAPGAPCLRFLAGIEITACVERYLEHLRTDRGLTRERARRLLLEYGPARGLINDLVADALRADHGIDVPPRAVVVTVGAQEAMVCALRCLCRPGTDLLAVVEPCFAGITGAARVLDIGIAPVGERGRGVDLDRLTALCGAARAAGRRVRALYVAPDFANPSGLLLDLAARHALLDAAEREDLLLLEDTAYGFTAEPGRELPPLKRLDRDGRVILIGTFAKVCLPGARVGYAVADQTVTGPAGRTRLLADDLAAVKSALTVNTPPLSQAVVGGLLLEHGGSLAALGRQKSAHYRRRLAQLLSALDRHLPAGAGRPDGVTWNRPDGGFFVRMRLPVPVDEDLLETSATRFRVLWTPMAAFHLGDSGSHELRLSCSYLTAEQIDEGAARLAAFVRHVCATGAPGRKQ